MPSAVGMYFQYPLPSRMIESGSLGAEFQRRRAAAVRQVPLSNAFHPRR